MSERIPLTAEIDVSQALQALREVEDGLSEIDQSTLNVDAESGDAETNIEGVSDTLEQMEGTGEQANKTLQDSFKETAESASIFSGGADAVESSLRGASSAVATLQGPLGPLSGRLSTGATLFSRLRQSINATTASTRAFTIALAATGIGAIVVALGALFQAFRSTQRGQNAFRRAIEPLRFLLGNFFGLLQDISFILVDSVKAAFQDPIGAIRNFGASLLDFVLAPFETIANTGEGLADIIKGVFTLDRSLIDEGVGALKGEFEGIRDTFSGIGTTAADLFRDANQATNEAIAAGREIAEIEIELQRLRTDNIVPLEKLNAEYERLRNISRDQERSDEERIDALEKAIETAAEINRVKDEELELEQRALEARAEANDTDLEAQAEINRVAGQRIRLQADFERRTGRIISRLSGLKNQQSEVTEEVQKSVEGYELIEQAIENISNLENPTPDISLPIGSIAELEEQVRAINERINLATDDAERRRLMMIKQSYQDQIEAYRNVGDEKEKQDERQVKSTNKLADSIGRSAQGEIQRAESATEASKQVLKGLKNEIIAYAIRNAFASSGPLAFALAPIAAAAASRLTDSLVGFRRGGDFITTGPTPIMVGDNPGGRERVQVTPISSTNYNGPREENTQEAFERALKNVRIESVQRRSGTDMVETVRLVLKNEQQLGGNGDL